MGPVKTAALRGVTRIIARIFGISVDAVSILTPKRAADEVVAVDPVSRESRSGCCDKIPVSRTATMTSLEPLVVSQASGRLIFS